MFNKLYSYICVFYFKYFYLSKEDKKAINKVNPNNLMLITNESLVKEFFNLASHNTVTIARIDSKNAFESMLKLSDIYKNNVKGHFIKVKVTNEAKFLLFVVVFNTKIPNKACIFYLSSLISQLSYWLRSTEIEII